MNMIRKITSIRNRSRLLIYLGSSIWVFFILYSINSNFNGNSSDASDYSIYNLYDDYKYEQDSTTATSQKSDFDSFKNHTTFNYLVDILFSNNTKKEDFNSEVYENIFRNHDMNTILGTLSFSQRCDLYFKNVFIDNINWLFDPEYNYGVKAEGRQFEDYIKKNKQLLEEKFETKLKESKDKIKDEEKESKLKDFMKDEYIQYKDEINDQLVTNHLSLFRIFNKCYITNDEKSQIEKTQSFISDQQKLVHDSVSSSSDLNSKIPKFSLTDHEKLVDLLTTSPSTFENRVYPWISKQYPVYQRFTGKSYNEPPNYYEILGDPIQGTNKNIKATKDSNDDPFMKRFKNKCNGKGIVLTIGEKHVDHTVNLIHLLRALDNQLPIQIVYYDDVNEESKTKIVTAAQEDFTALPQSFNKISYLFEDNYLDNNGKGLRTQEIWFVNAYNSIHKSYRHKFSKFGNKLLAAFFNSFDEFMLIDADTVMMKPPIFFFNLKGYLETGTFFFRDRATSTRSTSDGKYVEKMSPNMIDSIMFDFPLISNYTRNNLYFKGLEHFQESGLLLINKNIHFNSLLSIIEINLISKLRRLSYGDKELIWIGFAINGDENYIFNSNPAGAIGELTPLEERHRSDGNPHNSQEICANHPGHIYTTGNSNNQNQNHHDLLWMNSGFRFCHQANDVDFENEVKISKKLKFLTTTNAFKTVYYSPLKITHAIVPPISPDLSKHTNIEDEPSGGWKLLRPYCRGYFWCAYSSIGGKINRATDEDNTVEGLLVSFTQEQTNVFSYLGDIWVGAE